MYYLVKFFSLFPLWLLQILGSIIGLITYWSSPKFRKRLQENAQQAGYSGSRFYLNVAKQTGMMFAEMPKIWFQPEYCLKHKIECHEADLIKTLREDPEGIVFITPHLGSFEITARYFAQHKPVTVMYRPPRREFLGPSLKKARDMSNMISVPANMSGIRAMIKALHQQTDVGILPDQVPKTKDGVWVPFFDKPAYTITLPAKLAKSKQRRLVIVAGERLAWGKGWRIHTQLIPLLERNETAEVSAYKINLAMEAIIHKMPTQYLWSYNRYKTPSVSSFEGYHESIKRILK